MKSIVVQPLDGPIDASVRLPASKSHLLRALAAAALAPGRSHLYGATSFEDSEAMIDVVTAFGATVTRGSDLWTVDGVGGRLAVPAAPVMCRESGVTARIAMALAGCLDGSCTIEVSGRLVERPFAGLIDVLEEQGVQVIGERPPFEIHGSGHLWGGDVRVDASLTTQFATALLIVGPIMQNPLSLEVIGLEGSTGYLRLTLEIMRMFGVDPVATTTGFDAPNNGYTAADIVVEADASSALYPVALAALSHGRVELVGFRLDTGHPDRRVLELLSECGGKTVSNQTGVVFDGSEVSLEGFDVDLSDAPDGALTVAVMALCADGPSRLTGLHSLRHKESDRLRAFASEAGRLGGRVRTTADSIEVEPSVISSGRINPHGDHRIAMAFATLAGAGKQLEIENPQVVDKTWPGFWQMVDNLSEK